MSMADGRAFAGAYKTVTRKTTIAATTPARAKKRPVARRPAAKVADAAAKDRSQPQFAPIRTKRVFEEICEQVRREMAAGSLRPGDKLPPERELAQKLGVSRAAVREALRSLEIAGVVGLHKGAHGGAFILKGDPDIVTRSIRELFPHPEKFKGGTAFITNLSALDGFTCFTAADTSEYEF